MGGSISAPARGGRASTTRRSGPMTSKAARSLWLSMPRRVLTRRALLVGLPSGSAGSTTTPAAPASPAATARAVPSRWLITLWPDAHRAR